MSTRKNKKYTAGQAKKGSERKAIEPLTKKEGCNVKAVRIFKHRDIGKIANKSVETKTAGECRVSRVVEPSLADLMGARSASPSASSCGGGRQQPRLPSGLRRMRLTNDKCLWLIKRWASLVEAHGDVKAGEGHLVRMIRIGMTSRKERTKKKGNAQQPQKTGTTRSKR